MELVRPHNLSEFKGKKEIKDNVSVYIKSSLKNNTTLDHCLFYGLAGTGKTTLALIIANELNQKIKIVQGGNIQKPTDIINIVLSLHEKDVLFIDEIHAINPQVVELLYSITEDFAIDINLGKDFNSKLTRVKIPHFTLVGATTNLGKIPRAFEERFGIIIYFGPYRKEEILEIINFYCKKYKIEISDKDKDLIAANSKGIPRIANKIIRRVKDFKSIDDKVSIKTILKRLGIIKNGINELDLKYLESLNEFNSPVGIKTISHAIMIDENTIEQKIEPYLIQLKYINKTSKGRCLTDNGKNFLAKI